MASTTPTPGHHRSPGGGPPAPPGGPRNKTVAAPRTEGQFGQLPHLVLADGSEPSGRAQGGPSPGRAAGPPEIRRRRRAGAPAVRGAGRAPPPHGSDSGVGKSDGGRGMGRDARNAAGRVSQRSSGRRFGATCVAGFSGASRPADRRWRDQGSPRRPGQALGRHGGPDEPTTRKSAGPTCRGGVGRSSRPPTPAPGCGGRPMTRPLAAEEQPRGAGGPRPTPADGRRVDGRPSP